MKKLVTAAVFMSLLLSTGSAYAHEFSGMKPSQRLLRELTVREHWRVKPFMGFQGFKRFQKAASGASIE